MSASLKKTIVALKYCLSKTVGKRVNKDKKNVETEHTGIQCAVTERNWTENADSERYFAPRGPI